MQFMKNNINIKYFCVKMLFEMKVLTKINILNKLYLNFTQTLHKSIIGIFIKLFTR